MPKRQRNPEICIAGIDFDVTDIRNVFIGDPIKNHWNPEIEEFPLHIIYGHPLEYKIFMFDSQEKVNSILNELNNMVH